MVKLNLSALRSLDPTVAVPHYDPTTTIPGIVHIGVGAFHRSHQAMYVDRLLNTGQHREWAIGGVGLMPSDQRLRDVLAAQDNLYTLVTWAPDGQVQARVIGALAEYLFAPDAPDRVIERLAAPTTRIVSLTITEGGYHVSDTTGAFGASAPEIRHDLQPNAVPISVFGFLTEALRRRLDRGLGAFTVMSCDNIQGNGRVARQALTSFARLKDAALADWIDEQVAFPSSMVDRITPVTTDQTRADVTARYGLEDAWPVMSESFTQWVLEDTFSLGRPPLELVGVQFVHDVEPYELMKLRLLNASHQAISYLGLLAGHIYVHEACQEPVFRAFVLTYMTAEATPTLRPVPGIDLAAYRGELIERFSSIAIRDTLARLAVDGSERISKFLLPVVRDQLTSGGNIDCGALVVAAWSRVLEGTDETGRQVVAQDRRGAALSAAARLEEQHPGALLDCAEVFGDLATNHRFRSGYIAARQRLHSQGPIGAMKTLLGH